MPFEDLGRFKNLMIQKKSLQKNTKGNTQKVHEDVIIIIFYDTSIKNFDLKNEYFIHGTRWQYL